MSSETTPGSLAAIAGAILVRPRERQDLMVKFALAVEELPEPAPFSDDIMDTPVTLIWDLGFYVENPAWRCEDPSYYGNERLHDEVFGALKCLRDLGVTVPDLSELDEQWRHLDPRHRSD